MSKRLSIAGFPVIRLAILLTAVLCLAISSSAQTFDQARLQQVMKDFTVILKVKVGISFGMQSSEHDIRLLGTIVTDQGLILFDGSQVTAEHSMASMSGMNLKVTPMSIEVTTMSGTKYKAEYIGVDRFTKLGFARITDAGAARFSPARFVSGQQFRVGSWLTGYMLLPEFVTPPIAADIGMISCLVESPERFPLTVGFNSMEMASVLFDERLVPVGVLGALMDPTASTSDAGGMIEGAGD
jgi:S1-C subfamily serine protease